MLFSLVFVKHVLHFQSVLLENDVKFGIQIGFEVFPLQIRLEFAQNAQRLLDGSEVLEGVVDELL